MYYRIKEARKAAKLTQRELAEKLGIKVSTLSGYEASGLSSSLTDIWLQLLKSMLSYDPSSSIIVIDPIAVYVE